MATSHFICPLFVYLINSFPQRLLKYFAIWQLKKFGLQSLTNLVNLWNVSADVSPSTNKCIEIH